jgi:hypothetical protein
MCKSTKKRILRGHALNRYKESLKLTDVQRDIIIGTLLGDASMQAMKGNQQSNLKFEQRIASVDYINHLHKTFEDWVGTPQKIRQIRGGGAKDRQSV